MRATLAPGFAEGHIAAGVEVSSTRAVAAENVASGRHRRRSARFQFFLYGNSGTGKTEFVWRLVAQIGAQTFIVADADEAGAENNRCSRLALRAEIRVQREQATAAESKATQLEARIADLKAELDRALKHAKTEREAASGARKEARAAAVEGAALKG